MKYDGVSIENELLKEHLMFENDSEGDYTYIVYGNKKVYYDKDEADYFWYDNNNKNISMIVRQENMLSKG